MGQQGEGEEAKRKKKSPGRILCLPATKVDSQVSSRVQAFSLGEYNVMRMKGEWENGIKKIRGGQSATIFPSLQYGLEGCGFYKTSVRAWKK